MNSLVKSKLEIKAKPDTTISTTTKVPQKRRVCHILFNTPTQLPNYAFFLYKEITLPAQIEDFTKKGGFFQSKSHLNLTKRVAMIQNDLNANIVDALLDSLIETSRLPIVPFHRYIESLQFGNNLLNKKLAEYLVELKKEDQKIDQIKTPEEYSKVLSQEIYFFNTFDQKMLETSKIYLKLTVTSEPLYEKHGYNPPLSLKSISYSYGLIEALGFGIEEFSFKLLKEGVIEIFYQYNFEDLLQAMELILMKKNTWEPSMVSLQAKETIIPCFQNVVSEFKINEKMQKVYKIYAIFNINSVYVFKKKTHPNKENQSQATSPLENMSPDNFLLKYYPSQRATPTSPGSNN